MSNRTPLHLWNIAKPITCQDLAANLALHLLTGNGFGYEECLNVDSSTLFGIELLKFVDREEGSVLCSLLSPKLH